MKNYSLFCFILLVYFISSNNCSSQYRYKDYNKFCFYLGTNIIDDSYTSEHSLTNISKRMSIVPYPSYFGFGAKLSHNYFIDATVTVNKYKRDKLVDGEYITDSRTYFATDLFLKYDLSDINYKLNFLPYLNPFITVGTGFSSIDNVSRATFNYGFGTYVWFKGHDVSYLYNLENKFGLLFQIHGKSSFKQKGFGNQIQLLVGVAYRIE